MDESIGGFGSAGFIRSEFDIKSLILYVLHRLPAPVSSDELCQLVMVDGGFGYFDYAQCLASLVERGCVEEKQNLYSITPAGASAADALESLVPAPVQLKANRAAAPVARRMVRDATIMTGVEKSDNGYIVHLRLCDEGKIILDLNLFAESLETAQGLEKVFSDDPKSFRSRIIAILGEAY